MRNVIEDLRKSLLFSFYVAGLLLMNACSSSDYDDSALVNRVDNLENRIESLEEFCEQMNTNISSLQILVTALQNNDYITGIVPIKQGNDILGYTISFGKAESITIFNGKDGINGSDGSDGDNGSDGKDGMTPLIGVKQDTDGIFYWTINGEWLKDEDGNKIQAQGTNGKDGEDGMNGTDAIIPQLKIENNYWYVSYDAGSSWKQLGKATGEDGKSFFQDISNEENYLNLTLNDGTVISIPKNNLLSIDFDNLKNVYVLPNKTYLISYTLRGANNNTNVKVLAQDGFRATVKEAGLTHGVIEITTPATIIDTDILIFVSDEDKPVVMRSISILEGIIHIATRAYTMSHIGGQVNVQLLTNMNYSVEISQKDREWINLLPKTKKMRDETISFIIQQNANGARSATITLTDSFGVVIESILISQEGNPTQIIHVEIAGTLKQIISTIDNNTIEELKVTGVLNSIDFQFLHSMQGLKVLDLTEIENTTIPSKAFAESSIPTVLLPAKLQAIPDSAFYKSKITSLMIPEEVKSIGEYAFYETEDLNGSVIIPDLVTIIADYAFTRSGFNGTLILGKSLKSIGKSAFRDCNKAIGGLIIPDAVKTIGSLAFASSFTGELKIGKGLTSISEHAFSSGFNGSLVIPDNITYIGDFAFAYSRFTGNLVISDNVKSIGAYAFYNCTSFNNDLIIGEKVTSIGDAAFATMWGASSYSYLNFKRVYCRAIIPPTIYTYSFGGGAYGRIPYLGVPVGSKHVYGNTIGWNKQFVSIAEVSF